MSPEFGPFDQTRVRAHRARAARGFADAAFLHAHAALDLAERLDAVNRTFESALLLGPGVMLGPLQTRARAWVSCDLEPRLCPGGVAAAPERLPFADGAFDLCVSLLNLHWVNDLPGALIQVRRALKPDGLFLGAMLGGDTLMELRLALLEAEADLTAGAAARVSPFADSRDLGALLQRAGFALPVVDRERLTVRYSHPLKLMADLRGMAETSALRERAPPLRRAVLARAFELYAARHSQSDGKITATFDVLVATGWAPHENQQRPLRPGSAKARLADALSAREESAGEKAGG